MGSKLLGLFFNMASWCWKPSSPDLKGGLPGIALGQLEFVRRGGKGVFPLGLPVLRGERGFVMGPALLEILTVVY